MFYNILFLKHNFYQEVKPPNDNSNKYLGMEHNEYGNETSIRIICSRINKRLDSSTLDNENEATEVRSRNNYF